MQKYFDNTFFQNILALWMTKVAFWGDGAYDTLSVNNSDS